MFYDLRAGGMYYEPAQQKVAESLRVSVATLKRWRRYARMSWRERKPEPNPLGPVPEWVKQGVRVNDEASHMGMENIEIPNLDAGEDWDDEADFARS